MITLGRIGNAALLAIAVALGALIWQMLVTSVDVRPIAQQTASLPRAHMPTNTELRLNGDRPASEYSEILTRPLFRADRRPFIAPPPPAQEPARPIDVATAEQAPPPTPPQGLLLVGIVRDGRGLSRALFRSAQTKGADWINVGEQVSGWELAAIGSAQVTLSSGDARITLEMYPKSAADPRSDPGDSDAPQP
ncbi:MAG: hypothetical protein ACRCS9_10985 [Hyphomicrobium sp.]